LPHLFFQVSVLDVPDLQQPAGTVWLRQKLAEAVAISLEQTGLFTVVRHGGAYPVDTNTLFLAANRGSAYVVAPQLVEIDSTAIRLKLDWYDTETLQRVAPLSRPVVLDVLDYTRPIAGWTNDVILYFSGRPGIMGLRLACIRKLEPGIKELFVLTYGGAEPEQITFDRSLTLLPSWTVDGRVAYTSYKERLPKIFLQGVEAPLVAFEGMNSGLAWTRDGSMAAVTLSKDGNPEIYLLEGTTGEVRARLTDDSGIDTSPSWSPDGKQIAFCSDRDGTPQIWVMGADGAGQRRLTFSGVYNTSPAWHPFGNYIAYTGRAGASFQIFRLDLDTGEVRQLSPGGGDAESPDWSPDGRLIAFSWNRGNRQDIYLMNPDGSGIRRLTTDGGPYSSPVWEMLPPR
jgi:TolB protein